MWYNRRCVLVKKFSCVNTARHISHLCYRHHSFPPTIITSQPCTYASYAEPLLNEGPKRTTTTFPEDDLIACSVVGCLSHCALKSFPVGTDCFMLPESCNKSIQVPSC